MATHSGVLVPMPDLDRIYQRLEQIADSQARTETIVEGILTEAKRTNGRVSAAELWQAAADLAAAKAAGVTIGRNGVVLTKTQLAAIVSIGGAVVTVGSLAAKFLGAFF